MTCDAETRLQAIKDKVNRAALRTNRDPSQIHLVAVTKNKGVEPIKEIVGAGIRMLGENRVQEFIEKYKELRDCAEWHFIGHLQRNKVKQIVDKTSLIHSLDSFKLAEEISRRACEKKREVRVLVQVNVAEEESKYGVRVEETLPFIREVRMLPGICVEGLMTVAPLVDQPEEVRPVFRELFRLGERVRSAQIPGVSMCYLSMGMSNDFEVAVEEGANLLRIGRAMFEPREG